MNKEEMLQFIKDEKPVCCCYINDKFKRENESTYECYQRMWPVLKQLENEKRIRFFYVEQCGGYEAIE